MPSRPLHPCPTPGCPALVQTGYCPAHAPKDTRPSASKRGYDKVWEEIREQVLSEEPACRLCGSEDNPHVDHIDGNPWHRQRPNLRRLCQSCHNARTARDQGRSEPGWKRYGRTHAAPVFG